MKSKSLKRLLCKNIQITIAEFLIFFILIPLSLIVIYFLPQNVKDVLILQSANPTLTSIYFSNFVHTEFGHFVNNLIYYLLLIFLILNFKSSRKRFHLTVFLFLTVLPILSSLFIILKPNISSRGFSAINAALMGYLLFSVYLYMKESWKITIGFSFLFSIFTFNVAFATLFYRGILPFLILLMISLFLFCWNKSNLKVIKKLISYSKKVKKSSRSETIYKVILFSMTVFFILFVWYLLFPKDVVSGQTGINVLSHYVGYSFGVFVPLIYE